MSGGETWTQTTFSRSLNLGFSRDVGSNIILSAFSSDEDKMSRDS